MKWPRCRGLVIIAEAAMRWEYQAATASTTLFGNNTASMT